MQRNILSGCCWAFCRRCAQSPSSIIGTRAQNACSNPRRWRWRGGNKKATRKALSISIHVTHKICITIIFRICIAIVFSVYPSCAHVVVLLTLILLDRNYECGKFCNYTSITNGGCCCCRLLKTSNFYESLYWMLWFRFFSYSFHLPLGTPSQVTTQRQIIASAEVIDAPRDITIQQHNGQNQIQIQSSPQKV